ncbi:TonB-dependent hemoglobin/transferrin/lactoferrin family receptor [Pandoraea sp.]|uniref:TonB-dependent hemoglobin/transferrin/lactoferrin family receptor n=1 Tax=Pandoraea sp. TaxID=1883445 RepID=UPI0035AFE08C
MSMRRDDRRYVANGSIRTRRGAVIRTEASPRHRGFEPRRHLPPLAAAVLAAFWLPAAVAQPATTDDSAQPAKPAQTSQRAPLQPAQANLREVNVTATRTPTDAERTPASISVITDQDLEEQQAQDIKEALRYEPGVTVRRAPYRPASAAAGGGRDGNSSINIRGLEGNRVALFEDGIRMPSSYSFGPLEAGRGDYMSMDVLRRIEILRGPASSLYGSDGLTGVVNFLTKDPQDLLDVFGKSTYFSLRPYYNSMDRSFGTTAQAAWGGEQWQGMVIVDGNKGHALDGRGGNDSASTSRTTANPQDSNGDSVLGKLVFNATPSSTFKLTGESVRRRVDSRVLSAVNPPTTLGLNTSDRLERNRLSLDYDFNDASRAYVQNIHALLYFQDAKNSQYAYEQRTAGDRTRDNTYKERTVGGSLQAQSHFATGPLTHKLVYGTDASLAYVTSYRNGTVPGVGESFPNKAFPDTDYTLFGAYLQDEIRYGALTVTPGIRYDAYWLSPKRNDPLYVSQTSSGTRVQPTSSNDSAFSPRLAIMYEIAPSLIPYVQYARGFRTPTPDQVNNGFSNPIFGYMSIANPNLKPETSDTFELGLRGRLTTTLGPLTYSTAVFAGNYRNFISQRNISGSGRPNDPLIYQFVNFSQARIQGWEGRATWALKGGLTLRTAMAYTHGTTEDNGAASQPLNTVNPFSMVLGVRYEPNSTWFAQADLLFQAAKSRSQIAKTCTAGTQQNQNCWAPPSSVVLDLSGGYRINKSATVYAGIYNVFDRKYWNWSDVRNLAENSTIKDAYSAPGRSVAVSLKLQY